MKSLSLEPEFIVDAWGHIRQGAVQIEGNQPAVPVSLKNKMLLPGFVNVHSHALQRALRGRAEQRSEDQPDTFWNWRTLMYRDVNHASLDDIEAIATLAYLEMVKAGFVAVGEFHYLHNDQSGKLYADPTAISQRMMKAAERVGIRQTLLTCAYERKNHKTALLPEQRRFGFKTAEDFLQFATEVRTSVNSPLLNHGIAIHSTRACSRKWIETIAESNQCYNIPLHIHASEQVQEVEEAFLEYGMSPVEALKHFGALHENTTLVHATHLSHRDIDLIGDSRAHVALCPSTERNLGDGLCVIEDLYHAGIPICIGTDQHVRLDPVNELREIEEQERLRLKRRCILAEPGQTVAQSLIAIGTIHGRTSLGLSSDDADYVAVELCDTYEAAGPLAALNAHVLVGSHRDVTDVFIGGRHIVKDRVFDGEDEIRTEAIKAIRRLVTAQDIS